MVNNAEFLGFFGRHEVIPVECFLDNGVFIARMFDVNLVHLFLDFLRLGRVDHDVRGLSLVAARWLVNHDA